MRITTLAIFVLISLPGCSPGDGAFTPGDGSQNEARFYERLQRSADGGDADDGAVLTDMKYWAQASTREDSLAAIEMFKTYAESGSVKASARLVRIYLRGEGVSPDTTEAARWLAVGAENGSPEMQRSLDAWNAKPR